MAWAGLGPARRAGVWSGVRPASSPASSVRFPHVVLQDDQRLAEAKSSSLGCQLSIATPLLVRPRFGAAESNVKRGEARRGDAKAREREVKDQSQISGAKAYSQSHKLDSALSAGAKGREASMANVTACPAFAYAEWLAGRMCSCSCSCSSSPAFRR
ncbi:hypothetical protein V8C26DRAFT_201482 [Trichoderma gracile]